MIFRQQLIQLAARARGFHLVTSEIVRGIPAIGDLRSGFVQLFLQHTSASLSINENADPDVRRDLEMAISKIAPENWPYDHTCEGPDDMPAHVKSSMLGCSLLLPIQDGELALGTWQGIYLCEHRNHATSRRILATACGVTVCEATG